MAATVVLLTLYDDLYPVVRNLTLTAFEGSMARLPFKDNLKPGASTHLYRLTVYHQVVLSEVIGSFRCKHTEAFFHGEIGTFPPSDIRAVAQRKLAQLAAAVIAEDLRQPPGNHLEQLHGDREGQWSIRINRQWRICFTWQSRSVMQPDGTVVQVGQPHDVEIVDYH